MDKFNHILFEYTTLLEIIIMFFIFKFFVYSDLDSRIYAIAIFIIYLKHHHLGSNVEEEKVSETIVTTKSVNRKFSYWLDIPTFTVAALFLGNVANFYWSTLIFIIWFIVTDILRVRYTVYGNYVSRWFYKSKININNHKWELHIADPDPFPSIPHMHALNAPLKLNVYSGKIYDSRNKRLIEVASKKELKKLWEDKNFKQAVIECRRIYLGTHPNVKLPQIPTFN